MTSRRVPARGWPWATPLAAAFSFLPFLACAQTQTVIITGNPLGRDTLAQPSSVLSGEGLALRRSGTLGDTLSGLPGVAATGFGPNASRPIIRGLDGDRVRLLDNGGASIDASSLSFDHASATDPLVAERIEVLRGPAALLYGGSATGGVVNSVDNRIPRAAATGLGDVFGRAELRLGGAAAERGGAAVVEGGGGGLAWHADVLARQSGDLRVPLYTPVDAEGTVLDPSRRVRNSAARAESGAVGASWVSGDSYAGGSVETARQHYGVTAEPDVTIRMQRDRLALAGQWVGSGFINQVQAQGSQTRYEHQEVQADGSIGTTFKSRGQDERLQARHRAVPLVGGELQGVWGAQLEQLDFSALGEEAFVPGTRTRSQALFGLEEWSVGAFTFSLGARAEQVSVASDGDADPVAEARFGAATSRSFAPRSTALALKAVPAAGWQLTGTLAWTQRAPTYYELYANGLHVATGAYERGDPGQSVERSQHAELGAAWAGAGGGFSAHVFRTSFSRYLSLDASGRLITIAGANGAPDTEVPEYLFRGVRARLEGAEAEAHARLFQGAGFSVEGRASADTVRGTERDQAQPLPRLAPWRARMALVAKGSGWQAGAEVRHNAAQNRVPATDTATPGFTMLDLWAGAVLPVPGAPQLLVKLGNATDKLAYNASTIATIRGLAPLPGRALSVVLRAAF